MSALTAELPRLVALQTLDLSGNKRVTESGWVSLWEALPLLRVLQAMRVCFCGMDSSSGRNIAGVLPHCTKTLSSFWLAGNLFDERTASKLQEAWGARTTGGLAFPKD
jgi:hypothetical protein